MRGAARAVGPAPGPLPPSHGVPAMPEILHETAGAPARSPADLASSYEGHLVCDNVVRPDTANRRQQFQALARSLRDLLTRRWLATQQAHERENPKYVYYLSMEFL